MPWARGQALDHRPYAKRVQHRVMMDDAVAAGYTVLTLAVFKAVVERIL